MNLRIIERLLDELQTSAAEMGEIGAMQGEPRLHVAARARMSAYRKALLIVLSGDDDQVAF